VPKRAAPRSKRARPPQPQTPRDFFDAEAYHLLTTMLIQRAESWQGDWLPPIYFSGRDSEPRWDEYAQQRIAGATLRAAGRKVFVDSLSLDLERALRLLTLPWDEATHTLDGHDPEAWRVGLAGAFWRIGQLYRELSRRKGVAWARALLAQIIDALWK
jgi:hypothetical protein